METPPTINVTNSRREVIRAVPIRFTEPGSALAVIVDRQTSTKDYRWSLSHIPSGQRIAAFRLLAQAKGALVALNATSIPWHGAEADIVTPDHARIVREIAALYQGVA